MKRLIPILIAATLLFAAACGDSSTTTSAPPATSPSGPDPAAVILDIEENGGCAMMGPNCRHFRLYGDGTFEVFRTGAEADGPVTAGTIDPSIVDELWTEMIDADYQVILDGLAPGECQACFDGVDTVVTFAYNGSQWVFNSAEVELDLSVPLIVAASNAAAAMDRGFDDFPIVSR